MTYQAHSRAVQTVWSSRFGFMTPLSRTKETDLGRAPVGGDHMKRNESPLVSASQTREGMSTEVARDWCQLSPPDVLRRFAF